MPFLPTDHESKELTEHENRIFNEDCIAGMRRLPSDIVDLVITDPPFGINFKANRPNYNRISHRVLDGYSDVSRMNYQEFTKSWLAEVQRVLKPSGSAFVFSGWNNLKDILNALSEVDLETINHIIWKYQFGVVTKRKFVTSHYHCLFVAKDDKQRAFHVNSRFSRDDRTENGNSARYRDMEDVWEIKREYWTGDIKTPTKLPRQLIEKILDYASLEGDLVLDPFLGSGQVPVVAQEHNRRFLGYEIVPEYFEFAERRLTTRSYRIPDQTSS
ncbi:MAG: site-specific DNA-methyltransferase [Gammaproteobacteria bacterium]|nr:site-specific DNA-methyltransferase [Gammaproteobacteria bacterium]